MTGREAGLRIEGVKHSNLKTGLEKRIGELQREIDRLVDAIAKGHGDPAVLGPRSTALNEERKELVLAWTQKPQPRTRSPYIRRSWRAMSSSFRSSRKRFRKAYGRGTRILRRR
jgi:hypothetical protein